MIAIVTTNDGNSGIEGVAVAAVEVIGLGVVGEGSGFCVAAAVIDGEGTADADGLKLGNGIASVGSITKVQFWVVKVEPSFHNSAKSW